MQRHVLVLLVTFDLWVSLLVSVFPCLFWIWLCFASAGLPGSGWGARQYLLQQSWGGGSVPTSLASSAWAPAPGPQEVRFGLCRSHPCSLLTLGFACVSQAWADRRAG